MSVKIMKASNTASLETQINDCLKTMPDPVDIKYSTCYHGRGGTQDTIYSAMLIYK